MNGTDNVLLLRMVDGRVRIGLAETMIANSLICIEQADLVRDYFVDESLRRRGANIRDNVGDHVALTTYRASDDGFARTSRAGNAIAPLRRPAVVCCASGPVGSQ